MAKRKATRARGSNMNAAMEYWAEITLDGVRLLQRYGTTNRDTKETTISEKLGTRHDTPEAAREAYDNVVKVRLHPYKTKETSEIEIDVAEGALEEAARNPALEADLPGSATVYADWLQTNGDPRGELASFLIAGRKDKATEFLAANATRLFGDLDVVIDSGVYDLQWDHGFLSGASLKSFYESSTGLDELTRDFLALPIACTLYGLRFGLASYESDNDWSATMAAVTASERAAAMRSLRFDDYTYEDCEISWTPYGDFSGAWSKLPNLEELVIRSGAGGSLGSVEMLKLKRFHRISGGLGAAEIDEIIRASWPMLEELEIWFGREGYGAGGTREHVERLLAVAPESLHSLGLVNCEFTHELIAVLAASPVTKRLKRLDLSKSVITDEDVDLLLKHADAFAHLETFDLSENLLEVRTDEIAKRLPKAQLGDQRDNDRDRRYAALGE